MSRRLNRFIIDRAVAYHGSLCPGLAVGIQAARLALDHPRIAHLDHVLTDLIDGQGNPSLLVDLHDATAADAQQMSVFTDADERARQRGGSITLGNPPAPLHEALRQQGLGHLVKPLLPHGAEPARAADGSFGRERRWGTVLSTW